MTVLIFLTTAEADTGPSFDLYSNANNYSSPFESNVSKTALTTSPGYLTIAPDAATIVRVQSKGNCISHVDITLTKNPPIPCGATSSSGGPGISERTFDLSNEGGVLILAINGQGVPDKFEIIHNGTKKATSGMTTLNAGPFDDVYGTPPANTVPVPPANNNVDQFIGTSSSIAGGSIPTRNATFAAAYPSLSYITAAPKQQLIWWGYTSLDYSINPIAILRITGPTGTAWDFTRKCESTTTSSSTTSSSTTQPPTTTTTTTPSFNVNLSDPWSNSGTACATGTYPNALKTSSPLPLTLGSILRNQFGSTLFAGGGWWYKVQGGTDAVQVNGQGVVTNIAPCP